MTNHEPLNIDAEDFHIFYDTIDDSLMIKFYGNGKRPSIHHPIDRHFEALRDRDKHLTGLYITGFVRHILPELLQIGVIDPTIGHIHIGPSSPSPLSDKDAA